MVVALAARLGSSFSGVNPLSLSPMHPLEPLDIGLEPIRIPDIAGAAGHALKVL